MGYTPDTVQVTILTGDLTGLKTVVYIKELHATAD